MKNDILACRRCGGREGGTPYYVREAYRGRGGRALYVLECPVCAQDMIAVTGDAFLCSSEEFHAVCVEAWNDTQRSGTIFENILDERKLQDAEWGGPEKDDYDNSPTDWGVYIRGHAEQGVYAGRSGDLETYRYQMVRVAALAVAAIESIDCKGVSHG